MNHIKQILSNNEFIPMIRLIYTKYYSIFSSWSYEYLLAYTSYSNYSFEKGEPERHGRLH